MRNGAGIKFLVCVAIVLALIFLAWSWIVKFQTMSKKASTANGSSAWGSGGSGWFKTSVAGPIGNTAKSPVAQNSTDPGATPVYLGTTPTRHYAPPLVPGAEGLGGLHPPGAAGARPSGQGAGGWNIGPRLWRSLVGERSWFKTGTIRGAPSQTASNIKRRFY